MTYLNVVLSVPTNSEANATFWLNVLILKMYEINTLLLLPLKIYLIILKHIKTLILLKKLVLKATLMFSY